MANTNDDAVDEGSGLELFLISDVLDYLGENNSEVILLVLNVKHEGIEDEETRHTVRNLVLYPDEDVKNRALPDLNFCHTQSLSIFIFTAVIVGVIFAILYFLLFRFSSQIIQ